MGSADWFLFSATLRLKPIDVVSAELPWEIEPYLVFLPIILLHDPLGLI